MNLLKNSIGVDQAKELVIILKEHPTLKSLCGNNGNETELDMSGKMDGAEDAILLAAEVVDNGALYKLILKDNRLATAETGEVLGEALNGNTVLKELDVSGNCWDDTRYGGTKGDGPGFATGICKGLSGNGAMSCANGGSFKACHCPQCVQLKQTKRCEHCGQHKDQHKPKVIPKLFHVHDVHGNDLTCVCFVTRGHYWCCLWKVTTSGLMVARLWLKASKATK
jgi:hypothetical protein